MAISAVVFGDLRNAAKFLISNVIRAVSHFSPHNPLLYYHLICNHRYNFDTAPDIYYYFFKVCGQINAGVDEYVKQQLIAALFKFRFDR